MPFLKVPGTLPQKKEKKEKKTPSRPPPPGPPYASPDPECSPETCLGALSP